MSVYAQMIEELIKLSPFQMWDQWARSHHTKLGPLFAYVCPNRGIYVENPAGHVCGCLTQIRANNCKYAWTPELTQAIRQDERIPEDMSDIMRRWRDMSFDERRAVMVPLAEWQERIDKELNREPPAFQPAA